MFKKVRSFISSAYVSLTTFAIMGLHAERAYAAENQTTFVTMVGKIIGVIMFIIGVGGFAWGMMTLFSGIMALKKGREGMGGGQEEGFRKIGVGILAMGALPLGYLIFDYLWSAGEGGVPWQKNNFPIDNPNTLNPFSNQ